MLFEDCFIDISKETSESQSEILCKIGQLNIDQIKSVLQADKISDTAKSAFLYSAFEKADSYYKYKMLFYDCLIDISKETSESQSEILCKIGQLNIDQIKSVLKADKISDTAKSTFLYSAFEKASANCQYKMLFEDSLIDYSQISKIDRLHLWLKNLNPHYNYFEFVQVAWQLSNDERTLFNRRIKEHAKNERLQQFIEQIPKAKLLNEMENTKTYSCRWRNLYYKQGALQVFLDKTNATEDYLWQPAREEWNFLTQEYFNNRRIDDIIVTVNNNNDITEITGLENIEVSIIMAEVRKNGTSDRTTSITSNQLTRIIHNVSARNQCIRFLSQQNSKYNVLDIQELVIDDHGSIRRDVSFLFPIPDAKGNVYLIWESAEVEKSKATHIFKCTENDVETSEIKIKDFIESNIRTRSRLNSVEPDNTKIKEELQYCFRINHDTNEYQIWENRMREVLPFFK